jgi:hypothetical protein
MSPRKHLFDCDPRPIKKARRKHPFGWRPRTVRRRRTLPHLSPVKLERKTTDLGPTSAASTVAPCSHMKLHNLRFVDNTNTWQVLVVNEEGEVYATEQKVIGADVEQVALPNTLASKETIESAFLLQEKHSLAADATEVLRCANVTFIVRDVTFRFCQVENGFISWQPVAPGGLPVQLAITADGQNLVPEDPAYAAYKLQIFTLLTAAADVASVKKIK